MDDSSSTVLIKLEKEKERHSMYSVTNEGALNTGMFTKRVALCDPCFVLKLQFI